MLSLSDKFSYLLDSFARYGEPVICPSCGSTKSGLVDRKYLVTRLFECEDCGLYYRHPTEKKEESHQFYQATYSEGDNLTTYMPSEEELRELKSKSFKTSSNRSADRLLAIFEACLGDVNGRKLIDYGSSWGYISHQLKEAGMDVQSFEISVPRATFGNKTLGLDIKSDTTELKGENDIFFSSHVIEHVPSPSEMIQTGASLLTPQGYFIALCPNGSPEFRQKYPANFHLLWGKVHPNLITARFYQRAFQNHPYFITSRPADLADLKSWDKQSQVTKDLSEGELLVIARPGMRIPVAQS